MTARDENPWKQIVEAIYRPMQGHVFLKSRQWKKSKVEEKWYAEDGVLRTMVEAIGIEARKLLDSDDKESTP